MDTNAPETEVALGQPTTLGSPPAVQLESRWNDIKASRIEEVFNEYAKAGLLPARNLKDVLGLLNIFPSHQELARLKSACAANEDSMSLDEVSTLCVLLSVQSPSAPASPSKKFLTQRRQYMESGCLGREAAIVSYIGKLEEHRKKCEREGRYPEAQAAAVRLHELRTAEAERRRQDMLQRHQAELKEVEHAFDEEREKVDHMWELRFKHFQEAFDNLARKLQEQHEKECKEFFCEQDRRRPVRPKYSSDLLNKRRIEEYLVRQGDYKRAHVVKEAADCMETTEMQSTIAAFDAETRLKEHKMLNKQHQEMEALTQRGTRGGAELRIQHLAETARRGQRYKNVLAELQNLQKLEVVHLDNFLESQVQAGKRDPIRESSFRRATKIAIF